MPKLQPAQLWLFNWRGSVASRIPAFCHMLIFTVSDWVISVGKGQKEAGKHVTSESKTNPK